MFNYNPTVNDNSGQITAGYQTKSAEIKAAGNEALAKGIMDGVTNLAGGITGAIAKSQANTAKLQGIQATGEALQTILPQYGEEGIALGAALTDQLGKAGTNPDKLAGAMMAFMPAVENLQSRYNQKAQIDGYKELYTQKAQAAADAKAALPPKYDLNYATEFNKALYDNGITDPDQRKQKFNEAGIGHIYDKFINPPKQNMGFFGPITQ